jgi:hypothetical protein
VYLKAMLVCDDVRVELGGTITLVGVHNERLTAPPGDGPIRIAKLMFIAIIGGLEGVESVAFRQRIREVSEPNLGAGPLQQEPHDPRADEHNFVFGDAPMVFLGSARTRSRWTSWGRAAARPIRARSRSSAASFR